MSVLAIRNYLPKTLLGRSILIVLLPVLILQVFTVYMFFDRHWSRMTNRLAFAVAGEVAVIADVIETSDNPEESLTNILNYVVRSLDLQVTFDPGGALSPVHTRTTYLKQLVIDTLSRAVRDQVGRPFTVRLLNNEDRVEIRVQLKTGVLNVWALQRRLYSSSSYIFLLWMVSISLLLTFVSMIFLRGQIRPIRKLAIAAQRFGKGQDVDDFKLHGAYEVRQAGRAFMEMRDRIKRQIEQRTAMLAGVSHDMRTPLTRLKLGLSLLPDNDDRRALERDVVLMEQMLSAYLDFARGSAGEAARAVDIVPLITDVVDHEKRGYTGVIDVDLPATLTATVRVQALTRALANVISNAKRFGSVIKVSVRRVEDDVVITIDDNGPGIPEDQRQEALKPFVRLSPARTIDHGGVGLGLSITQDLIQGQGGQVALLSAPDFGGLRVQITLPL